MVRRSIVSVSLTGLGVAALAFAGFQGAKRVYFNGKVMTSDARTIGGKVFVPLADVAKALELTAKKRPDGGWDLATAGGAGMIATKLVGNIGDELFTGKWRFQVLGIERMKERDPVFLPKENFNHLVAQSGREFVVVQCRFKNGTKVKDGIVLDKWDGNNTALTTANGQSIEPFRIGYDAVFNEHFPNGAKLLPGAGLDFYLIFEAPVGTEVKDLVFTCIRYDVRATFDQKKEAPASVRVHLN